MKNYLDSTTRNIAWFNKANSEHSIVMKPPFQRNLVWTHSQKSYLIDSVLEGYPIPELYMQEIVNEKGATTNTIVDGQQRISAIFEFIEGSFTISDKDSERWANYSFDDLNHDQKKKFFSYTFLVRILPDDDDEIIRSIFKRINKNNMKLNAQELRQATYWGNFIETMNKISDYDEWSNLGLFSANKVRRMEDVEFISELTIAHLHGPQNKKDKLDYYYQYYEQNDFEESARIESMFRNVVNEILILIPTIKKTRWRNLTDFYSLFLVLSENTLPFSSDKRTELSAKIISFGEKVSSYLKTSEEMGNNASFDQDVISYAQNIRASTDIKARISRQDILKKILGLDLGSV